MKAQWLVCKTKRRFKVTTQSISPNKLGRNFVAQQVNQKWVGDITYIPTDEGWVYLAIVIDLFSKRGVGWSMQSHMKASLVNDALLMTIGQRKPPKKLIWHTDPGSVYASKSHRKLIQAHGIIQSMSRQGNCWDNAVAESFFHTLKTELTHHFRFKTRAETKAVLFEYIEQFYNRKRLHSAND